MCVCVCVHVYLSIQGKRSVYPCPMFTLLDNSCYNSYLTCLSTICVCMLCVCVWIICFFPTGLIFTAHLYGVFSSCWALVLVCTHVYTHATCACVHGCMLLVKWHVAAAKYCCMHNNARSSSAFCNIMFCVGYGLFSEVTAAS